MITIEDIKKYLEEVYEAVKLGKSKIELNQNRQENLDLFINYVLDVKGANDIILSLTSDDFSEIRKNTHPGYEDELLYIFAKDVILLERFRNNKKQVHLYIKINKLANGYVIIISIHEQKYPMKKYFDGRSK